LTAALPKVPECFMASNTLESISTKNKLNRSLHDFSFQFWCTVVKYSEVWYHRHLFVHPKERIRSCHYRALRLVYGKQKTRDELDQLSFRATPDEWTDYSVAKSAIKMVNSMMSCHLYVNLMANSFAERRQPQRLLFYDSIYWKVRRQSIKNRLTTIAKHIKFNWFDVNYPPDRVRIELKKSFFTYSHFQWLRFFCPRRSTPPSFK